MSIENNIYGSRGSRFFLTNCNQHDTLECMEFELAPMEGLTTYLYRNTFHKYFGGIDTYYTPFLALGRMNKKAIRDTMPENNPGIRLVPQMISNQVNDFLRTAKDLQAYGYEEINFNLGCPSGTVTSKKRGAGFLSIPDELDAFLAQIFDACPLALSIKTRIGISEPEEWDRLLEIYAKYPIKKLIIHTRTLKDMYAHPARPEAFGDALARLSVPLSYNGDITSEAAYQKIVDLYGDRLQCVMMGRGLIANPNLILQLREEPLKDKNVYRAFIDELLEEYQRLMEGGDRVLLFKMKEVWAYFDQSFTESDRYIKMIRKSKTLGEYKAAVNLLFENCDLR